MSISSIIYNGNIIPSNQACIKSNDRSFTLGDGLFETILVKKSSFPALDYHWRRLEASAAITGIAVPFTYQELELMLSQLIKKNKLQNKMAGARLTITSGESERGILPSPQTKPNFVIAVFELASVISAEYSAIIVSVIKNEYAPCSRVKSTSYLDNILAKKEAVNLGYDEAILLNTASNIADGAISNIYMVKNKQIFTPPISDGALPGVVRSMLFEECDHQFSITEKSLSVADILDADEVFVTNALMGVRPVSRLNTKKFDFSPIANSIGNALRETKDYI